MTKFLPVEIVCECERIRQISELELLRQKFFKKTRIISNKLNIDEVESVAIDSFDDVKHRIFEVVQKIKAWIFANVWFIQYLSHLPSFDID